MLNYPLGLVLEVDDLSEPTTLFVDDFAMEVKVRHDDEVVLDNGTLSIRLVRRSEPRSGAVMDVATEDLSAARQMFERRAGYVVLEQGFITTHREVLKVATPFGCELWLGRDHDEDALGIQAPLPTELCWSEPAERVIQALAARVPAPFRDLMRRKTVQQAERAAVARGSIDVDCRTAVDAAIDVTPEFQMQTLRNNLQALGIDPDDPSTFSLDPLSDD